MMLIYTVSSFDRRISTGIRTRDGFYSAQKWIYKCKFNKFSTTAWVVSHMIMLVF